MAVVKSLQKEHHVSTVRWYCCSWNQELVFPFHSWPTACVITALKDQEKPSPKISFMASSLTTSIFFMFQIKHPTYQEKKAFRNGMCPINVKKTDGIKQVMKCIDQGYEDYSTVLSFTGDKQLIPMYNLRRSRIRVNVYKMCGNGTYQKQKLCRLWEEVSCHQISTSAPTWTDWRKPRKISRKPPSGEDVN